jgi:hypothetical protein
MKMSVKLQHFGQIVMGCVADNGLGHFASRAGVTW